MTTIMSGFRKHTMRLRKQVRYSLLPAFFLCVALCEAQVPYRQTVPDVKYNVSGERRPSRLSNDDALFTILVFEDENAPEELTYLHKLTEGK